MNLFGKILSGITGFMGALAFAVLTALCIIFFTTGSYYGNMLWAVVPIILIVAGLAVGGIGYCEKNEEKALKITHEVIYTLLLCALAVFVRLVTFILSDVNIVSEGAFIAYVSSAVNTALVIYCGNAMTGRHSYGALGGLLYALISFSEGYICNACGENFTEGIYSAVSEILMLSGLMLLLFSENYGKTKAVVFNITGGVLLGLSASWEPMYLIIFLGIILMKIISGSDKKLNATKYGAIAFSAGIIYINFFLPVDYFGKLKTNFNIDYDMQKGLLNLPESIFGSIRFERSFLLNYIQYIILGAAVLFAAFAMVCGALYFEKKIIALGFFTFISMLCTIIFGYNINSIISIIPLSTVMAAGGIMGAEKISKTLILKNEQREKQAEITEEAESADNKEGK